MSALLAILVAAGALLTPPPPAPDPYKQDPAWQAEHGYSERTMPKHHHVQGWATQGGAL